MTLLQVEIINPRAGRLLQELEAMDLIVITRDVEAVRKSRQMPPHLRNRGKILGDIISPIVPAEDWDCVRECEEEQQ